MKLTCNDGYITTSFYASEDCTGTMKAGYPTVLKDGGECLATAAAEDAGEAAEKGSGKGSGSVDGEDSALAVKTAAAAVAAAVAAVAVLA